MKKLFLIVFIVFGLSACTWVELSAEAEKVVILSSAEVKKCKDLGSTTVAVKYEVGGFERDSKTMTNELQTLARNSAAGLKGDAIVVASDIEKGTQKFKIYRCRPE